MASGSIGSLNAATPRTFDLCTIRTLFNIDPARQVIVQTPKLLPMSTMPTSGQQLANNLPPTTSTFADQSNVRIIKLQRAPVNSNNNNNANNNNKNVVCGIQNPQQHQAPQQTSPKFFQPTQIRPTTSNVRQPNPVSGASCVPSPLPPAAEISPTTTTPTQLMFVPGLFDLRKCELKTEPNAQQQQNHKTAGSVTSSCCDVNISSLSDSTTPNGSSSNDRSAASCCSSTTSVNVLDNSGATPPTTTTTISSSFVNPLDLLADAAIKQECNETMGSYDESGQIVTSTDARLTPVSNANDARSPDLIPVKPECSSTETAGQPLLMAQDGCWFELIPVPEDEMFSPSKIDTNHQFVTDVPFSPPPPAPSTKPISVFESPQKLAPVKQLTLDTASSSLQRLMPSISPTEEMQQQQQQQTTTTTTDKYTTLMNGVIRSMGQMSPTRAVQSWVFNRATGGIQSIRADTRSCSRTRPFRGKNPWMSRRVLSQQRVSPSNVRKRKQDLTALRGSSPPPKRTKFHPGFAAARFKQYQEQIKESKAKGEQIDDIINSVTQEAVGVMRRVKEEAEDKMLREQAEEFLKLFEAEQAKRQTKKSPGSKQPKPMRIKTTPLYKKAQLDTQTCARCRPVPEPTCARSRPYCWKLLNKGPIPFYFLRHSARVARYDIRNRKKERNELNARGKNWNVAPSLPLEMQYSRYCRGARVPLYLSKSLIHGIGVFAGQPVEPGTLMIEYCGELIRHSLTDKREAEYRKRGFGSYMFSLDSDVVVDATLKATAARFVNHSCDPNCQAKIISTESGKKIVLYASAFIDQGTELSYNYKLPYEDGEKIPCLCNKSNCKKFLN